MALFGCKFRCQSFAKRLLREPAIVRKPLPGWRAGLMLVFFWLLLFQIYIDGIARVETSSTRDSGDKTVIIGGGVIGLATAYFLALSLKSGDSITIIDQAPLLDLRDSGDVTGIVSGQTLPLELADFEEWSFDLHREFAARYNGHERWSFHERAMHHMRIQTSSIQKERSDNDTSYVDIWSSTGFVFESLTSDPVRPASYIDTKKFYHFLLQQCEMLGVKIIVKSTAKAVTINDDSITAIQVQTPEYELSLACKNLVIAAGAWSQNVIEVLFPQASYQSITTAKRQYMGINISNFQPGSSSGSGSDVYMELSKDTCPPNKHSSTPAANLPCEAIVEDLNELATTIMNVTTEKDTHLLKAGMAYIYESSSRRPVISRIPLVQLTSGSGEGTIDDLEQHQFHAGDALEFRIKRAWRSWTSSWFCSKILSDEKRFSTPACRDVQASHGMQGGVYLNTGHGMRGISLSLASGKLMSEIINNAQTSIPASKLGYNPWP